MRQYGSANEDPGEHWLALVEDEPVGWIQCYAWADYAHEEEAQARDHQEGEARAAGLGHVLAGQ